MRTFSFFHRPYKLGFILGVFTLINFAPLSPLLLNILLISAVLIFMRASKKAQEELKLERDKALAAVETKARFLATMSHEIRTPMNAVLSCTNLLFDSVNKPENVKLLKTVYRSGNTLLALINDILDFSKIESGKMELESEPFGLHDNTKEIVDLLSTQGSERGAVFSYRISEDVPSWIFGDVTRFRQILTNLVGNALKFTKNKVEVSVTSCALGGGRHEIKVSVSDNGIGMPEYVHSKLFQDYSQVDASTVRKFGGTGLGLAICKGLTEAMDGEIWVESRLHHGSTFHFTLIASEAEADHSKRRIEPAKVDPEMSLKNPLKILVAEDNSVNQMIIRKMLAKLGYRVDIVSNGLEAVDTVRKQSYDLVLMDQHMPEMDGVEATRKIRQFSRKKPLIFALTASAFKEDKDRCLDVGMNGFLTKPIDMEELVGALKECFSHFEKKSQIEIPSTSIQKCYSDLSKHLIRIKEAIAVQDAENLERSACLLKKVVSNFCADSIVRVSFRLELMGRNGDFSEAEEVYSSLEKQLGKLKLDLQRWNSEKSEKKSVA